MRCSRFAILIAASLFALAACGINSVTKAEIEVIKPGSKITYRFQKEGENRFYSDKVTRIEGEIIYFHTGRLESTSGTDKRLEDFDTSREFSIKKSDILKYETEQPPDSKKIIWIE